MQGHAGVRCLRCRGMPLPPLPPPTLPADSHSAAHIRLLHRRCRVLVAEANDCIATPLEFKRAFEQRQPRCVSSELVGRVVSARNVSGLRGEDTEQKLAYFWSASDALAKYLTIGYPEVGGWVGGGRVCKPEIRRTVEMQPVRWCASWTLLALWGLPVRHKILRGTVCPGNKTNLHA